MQLSLLQSFIKRDPETYREEFLSQNAYFANEMELLELNPTKECPRLLELVEFLSQTAHCYADLTFEFSAKLFAILDVKAESLHPTTRFKLFQALSAVHRQVDDDSSNILRLSFKLLCIHDKLFRSYVTEFITSEVKRIQAKKNHATVKNAILSFIHSLIDNPNSPIVFRCVEILVKLYRKRIWTEGRTVNILAQACLNDDAKVRYAAVNFFLGIESSLAMDEEEESNKITPSKDDISLHEHAKKTKKRARLIEKQKANLARKVSAKQNKESTHSLLPAIMAINDPQSLAEALFKRLKQPSSQEKFEQKLLLMNFISQLIGCHHLMILGFYSLVQRHLSAQTQTAQITQILAYLVQACHELVPPAEVVPVLKALAFHFISDRSSDESVTVGLNTCREVISRVPATLLEEDMDGFVQDLAQYAHQKKQKKCVVAASRAVINLVREQSPMLLKKMDRGRNHDKDALPKAYGEQRVATMPATDVEEEDEEDEEGEDGEGEWEDVRDDDEEVEDEDEEGEGEWQDVENNDNNDEIDVDQDGNDGWEEVGSNDPDSSDSDEEEEEEEAEEEDRHHHKKVRFDKVLTADDMAMIQKLSASRGLPSPSLPKNTKKSSNKKAMEVDEEEDEEEGSEDGSDSDEEESDDNGPDYVMDPSRLLPRGRLHKASKIERLQQILSGRVEKRFEHEGHAGGLTNEEKRRKKNFVMVRKGKRSVTNKNRTSVAEKRFKNSKKVCCHLSFAFCIF